MFAESDALFGRCINRLVSDFNDNVPTMIEKLSHRNQQGGVA
jgi:hypothetical protein